MNRLSLAFLFLAVLASSTSYGQEWPSLITGERSHRSEKFTEPTPFLGGLNDAKDWKTEASSGSLDFCRIDFDNLVVRGQSSGGSSSGAGAADATDPSAILTQFQIQNIFTPKTYDANGYSNSLILQPVLPFPVAMPGLRDFLPNHIIRPTLPIISPTADPDGPLGVEGGLGDLTLLDIGVRPVEGFGNLMFGYTAILPTATHPQLGLREWQLGPAAGIIYKEIPKTIVGFLYQQPFSFQSDAQQVLIQPILVRHLPEEWYVGWGDLEWTVNTDTGDYNIPINV